MSGVVHPAVLYAGLVAIEHGVRAAKAEAAAECSAWAEENGLRKGAVNTALGPVTLRENPGREHVQVDDEAAFLAWAKTNHPEAVETVERFRPADREAILTSRFVTVTGDVVDRVTGEPVPFARVVATSDQPPTPVYGPSDLQRETKRAAELWAKERAGAVVGNVRAMLTGTAVPE